MAKLYFDLSGLKGLTERHQGDLNDTASVPKLRYLGEDGQSADGIFNPFKTLGYMSTANNTYTTLTGTVADPIVSIQYDNAGDDVYLAEGGSNILQLNSLADLSLSNYLTVAAGDIKDMELYELFGSKALLYIVDTASATDGLRVGFSTLSSSDGITPLDVSLAAQAGSAKALFWSITRTADFNSAVGKVKRNGQQFSTADYAEGNIVISGVKLFVSREGGTGVGITMKASIQTNADPATSPFTSRGAWSNAVANYVVNDTVTNGGFTWQCIEAHSAAGVANDEPGVGSNWEQYWNLFGAPSGTEVASGTVALSAISDLTDTDPDSSRTVFNFVTPVTLTANTLYWIVLEESGTVMASGDLCAWNSTVNDNGAYARLAKIYSPTNTFWRDINFNGDDLTNNHDNFEFALVTNRADDWSTTGASGAFDEPGGVDSFLYLADNGLLYWFTPKAAHAIDGSVTGGPVGRITEDVLTFPTYINVVDVTETRSRMYMGIQSSERTSSLDHKTFPAKRIGVFSWDRRSQVMGATDFYPCPGAKEIRSVFTSSTGDPMAITVGNSGFAEIRGISGNQFAVLHTLEKGGYPQHRRGVSQVDNMTVWLGLNGIFYVYGQIAPGTDAQLYKIGTMAGQVVSGATPTTGPIFVGHSETTEPRSAIIFGWKDGNAASSPNALIDFYSESNDSGSSPAIGTDVSVSAVGQSFVATAKRITKATFFLRNSSGNYAGYARAKLYTSSGGVPTGTALAVSDPVDVDTIDNELTTFYFPPPQQYLMTNGVTYFIVFDNAGQQIQVSRDNTAPSHSGTSATYSSGAWSAQAGVDYCFYVYGDASAYIQKWYPNGDGTIDLLTQVGHIGDVYTLVKQIPSFSTVRYMNLFMAPQTNAASTTAATVKVYFNQSSTPDMTFTVSYNDTLKGFKECPINKPNVNFIQLEVEWNTTPTLGTDDFLPMYAEIEYDDEERMGG